MGPSNRRRIPIHYAKKIIESYTVTKWKKAIKCKGILGFKSGHKGVEPRLKASLVTCGYDELYGIDNLTSNSPLVKHYSIRNILGIVAALDLELIQLDIKTAFLYGNLNENETIYMHQPEGYVVHGREDEICLLDRPIYGLKKPRMLE